MKRIFTRIALVPLMAAGLMTSCLLDPENKKGPGSDPTPTVYEDLTQKDHVLLNLDKAYNEMNIDEYKRLLVNEFTFFFSQEDIDSNLVQNVSWGRLAEEEATSNMFNRVPSTKEGFVIDRIDLRLDYTPGDDVWIREVGSPGNHEGEDWYERTVTYNMTITAGDESFISVDIIASFVIKQVDVNGAMIWKIVAWRDDIGP